MDSLPKKLLKVNRKYKLSLNSPMRLFPELKKCKNIRKISLNQSNEGLQSPKMEKRKIGVDRIKSLFSPKKERQPQQDQIPQRKPIMFRRLNRQRGNTGVFSEEPKIRNLALQRLQLCGMDEKAEMVMSPTAKKVKENIFSFKNQNRTLRAFSPVPDVKTPKIKVGRVTKKLMKDLL
ncbi:unnamed protein product [Moneuplotes crassus]|uniref:Uncharacterized protein n=1 Tax=Euplotes crassus TaxID=5936 RepID=A0AAD1UTE6_EUPCR|nr:unnamed protein product [Moneuplotes crassus]